MNWVMLWGDLGDVVGCMEWFRVMVGRTLVGWFLGGLGVLPGCIGVYGIVWTRFGGLWGGGIGAKPRVDGTMGKTKACAMG